MWLHTSPASKTLVFISFFRPSISMAAILVLLLLLVARCQATPSNQFLRLTTYPTGGTPTTMVAADFNRDGKADLVVLNSNGVLSFVEGTGAGAFDAPVKIATLPLSSANAIMVAGDFNGDGKVDLALLPPPGKAVQVFLGHGDGTFAGSVKISDGLPSAGTLASGDFNNDGRADIFVAGTTSVAILLGNGNSTFDKPQVTKTGLTAAAGALAIALGDVNGDSHLDVALTDENGNLQILLGSASGALHPQTVSGVLGNYPTAPTVIAIADFNGDGKLDIAAGDGGFPIQYTYPLVCILNGNGDGTFAPAQECQSVILNSFSEILVTNLNGKPGYTFPADPLILVVNNGNGTFSQTSYSVGGPILGWPNYSAGGPIALADFNGDGRQDIASANAGGVQVVLSAGGGRVRAPLSIVQAGIPFGFNVAMNTSDMNRDGYADLILAEYWSEHGANEPSVAVLLGGPRNSFTLSATAGLGFFAGNWPANPPAIGDFNGDGLLDVAYSSANYISYIDNNTYSDDQVFFGDGKGHLVSSGPALSFESNYLAAGYFNAGGAEDLASVDSSGLAVLLGKGNGTFAPAKNYGVGNNPVFVLQHDLNGDGKRDLLVVNQESDTISVLLGNGNGTFKPQVKYAAGKMPNVAVTGDFNRDGKIDIAVGSAAGISVLLGNGDGTFKPQKLYSATGPITGLAQAAVRQDGIDSLLGVDSAHSRFVLLPGVGNGTFSTPVFYPVDQVPISIVAGDFDRDGAPDVALITALQGVDPFSGNPIGGNLAVYYNQGGDHVALASTSVRPKATQSVTLTAHVSASPTEPGTPAGKITFKDGSHLLGTVTMKAGTASRSTKFAAGTHHILAEYSGDSNFNPSQSATLTIVAAP